MIGDVLTSSILIEALKQKYPDGELHYLINSHTFPVVQNNPFIDKIVFFEPKHKAIRHLIKLGKTIKSEKYDIVIDVYAKISSLLLTYLSKSKIRIGYRKYYTPLAYNTIVERKKTPEYNSSLALENRMKLLEPLGISFSPILPKIYLTEKEKQEAKQSLQAQGLNLQYPTYMISVLGSSPKKTYPAEYMAKCLDYLTEATLNLQLLFNYIPKQEEEAKAIFNFCNKATQKHIFFDIYGKSLREFLAITANCDALIGNEGGAVNMAKALDIPTFTIFNPVLKKQNWFGASETKKHVAVHLEDYNDQIHEAANSSKDVENLYKKFKPEYFREKLLAFLKTIQ